MSVKKPPGAICTGSERLLRDLCNATEQASNSAKEFHDEWGWRVVLRHTVVLGSCAQLARSS